MIRESSLPYRDTKPQGASDFYLCINATFRFIHQRLGEAELRRYWTELGANYFQPVSQLWAEGGLGAVARYWRDFFAAEPGEQVEVLELASQVTLEVKECPAIAHLKACQREIDPLFCQHCYFVSEAMAEKAGLTVRVEGGNGRCVQRFQRPTESLEPQALEEITLCA